MNAVVIGGGLGGLVAARELAQRGEQVVLLEAAETFGGMVAATELAGVSIDSGAEAYATRTDAVAKLCQELGLTVAGPAGQPHIFWPDSGARWPVATGMLGIPANLADPALKLALTPAELELTSQLSASPKPVSATPNLAELVSAHLGEAVVEKLVAPLTRGVYAMAPDQMSVARFAPGLLEQLAQENQLCQAVAALTSGKPAVEQPIGGMFTLVAALVAELIELGAELRTSSRVSKLQADGQGWLVETIGAPITAEKVVLAVPARVAANLLAGVGIKFDQPKVGVARNLLLALDHPGLASAPIGSGILLGKPTDQVTAKALTHYSVKWPWAASAGMHILRLAWPAELELSLPQALADISTLTGLEIKESQLVDHKFVTWAELPRVIAAAEREALLAQVAQRPGLAITGAWLAGNGLSAVVADAKQVATCC